MASKSFIGILNLWVDVVRLGEPKILPCTLLVLASASTWLFLRFPHLLFLAKIIIRPNQFFSALPAASAVSSSSFVVKMLIFLCVLRALCGETIFGCGSANCATSMYFFRF
jgi:hypothetical protein